MEGLTHADAVQLLKTAGRRAEITIKRKAIVKVPTNSNPKPMPRAKSREYLETNRDSESDRTGTNTYSSRQSRGRSRTKRDSYSEYSDEEDSRYSISFNLIFSEKARKDLSKIIKKQEVTD